MRAIQFLSAIALSASFALGQCAFASASVSSYGQPCAIWLGPAPPTSLGVQLDGTSCTLGLDVTAFPGCCNTFLTGRILVLGLAQISVPVPQFGVNCDLLVSPDVILFQQSSGQFTMPLPNAPFPPTTIYAQGAVIYFTTIGLAADWALSAGYQIDLQ